MKLLRVVRRPTGGGGYWYDYQYGDKPMAKPMEYKLMTVESLQKRVRKVIRLTRKQFNRAHFEEGMSDNEFIRNILEPLDHDIKTDLIVRAKRKAQK